MARPPINTWGGELFKRQLTAALDYLDTSGGGSGGASLLGLRLSVQPTEPVGAADYDLWIEGAAPAAPQISVAIGITPPASPAVGQMWIDTN